MLGPARSVAGTGKKFVDESGNRMIGALFPEHCHAIRRGRQSVQIEEETSDQGPRVSRLGKFEAMFSQFSFDEGIDGMAIGAWRIHHTKWLEGPVLLIARMQDAICSQTCGEE